MCAGVCGFNIFTKPLFVGEKSSPFDVQSILIYVLPTFMATSAIQTHLIWSENSWVEMACRNCIFLLKNLYSEVLAPIASDYECVWRGGLCRSSWGKEQTLLEWECALTVMWMKFPWKRFGCKGGCSHATSAHEGQDGDYQCASSDNDVPSKPPWARIKA